MKENLVLQIGSFANKTGECFWNKGGQKSFFTKNGKPNVISYKEKIRHKTVLEEKDFSFPFKNKIQREKNIWIDTYALSENQYANQNFKYDDIEDSMRVFCEKMDFLDSFWILSELDGIFGELGSCVVEYLTEEYPKKTKFFFGAGGSEIGSAISFLTVSENVDSFFSLLPNNFAYCSCNKNIRKDNKYIFELSSKPIEIFTSLLDTYISSDLNLLLKQQPRKNIFGIGMGSKKNCFLDYKENDCFFSFTEPKKFALYSELLIEKGDENQKLKQNKTIKIFRKSIQDPFVSYNISSTSFWNEYIQTNLLKQKKLDEEQKEQLKILADEYNIKNNK